VSIDAYSLLYFLFLPCLIDIKHGSTADLITNAMKFYLYI